MCKIGITGGIGSGKTTVARVIERLGYPVYFSDAAAARLVNEDTALRDALVARFGQVYTPDGTLDRRRFASLIFNDADALAFANGLIHPAVMRDFAGWCAARRAPLLFLESAILFEAGLADAFDAIILVQADLETRVARVARRDDISRERVLERVRSQEDIDASRADFIVSNNPGDMLVEQVLAIINQLTTTRV